MSHIKVPASLVCGLLLASLSFTSARAQDAPKGDAATVKKVPVHTTTAVSGKDLFREYCAVCHGADGKGGGPAAAALKTTPADLTQISKKNGGKFDEMRISHIINGESDMPAAHGSKEMPMWGDLFGHMGSTSGMANVRVHNLVKYIESIQVK